MPRLHALASVVTFDDRTGMLTTVMFATCCLPPNQMTTVFAGLTRRRLELSHVDTSATQRENRLTAAAASVTGTLNLAVVSVLV